MVEYHASLVPKNYEILKSVLKCLRAAVRSEEVFADHLAFSVAREPCFGLNLHEQIFS